MINVTAARKAARKPLELNIAPLIDMVFILLIFFLVTTSFVRETGVTVDRPSAATAGSREKAGILIGVTAEGRIFMDKREIDLRAVRTAVERAMAENPGSDVVIVADRNSRTGLAIGVMDACRLAGATEVSIAANAPGEAGR